MLNYIGFFNQPVPNLEKWKGRGCNLAVSCPEGQDRNAWRAECRRLGLVYLDNPSANLALDAADPSLIGWVLPDEPRTLRGTKPGMEPLPFRSLCATLRAASSSKKLYCTFGGMDITAAYPWYKGEKDKPYFGDDRDLSSLTDIGVDWYPCNRGYPEDLVLRQLDLVKEWTSGSRKYVAVLECCDQGLPPSPGKTKVIPSKASILSQAKKVVDWGVETLIFFPQKPPPGFAWDNCNPEQIDAIKTVSSLYLKVQNTPPILDPMLERVKALESRIRVYDAVLESIQSTLKGQS